MDMIPVKLCKYFVFVLLLSGVLCTPVPEDDNPGGLTTCGGWLNGTKGFFGTPNFPQAFPTPLDCTWIIHARQDQKIVIYFTQFYVRSSLTVEEYTYYRDDSLYVEKSDLGEINYYKPFVALKPYLVLRFRRQDIGLIHYRVEEYFTDVYGFNITYEIIDKDSSLRADHCSMNLCSFLGHCYASRYFDSYKCHCYHGYHGNECQYGPYCNPATGINMCKNGGRCRYFLGSSVNTCECLPGFSGVQCEDVIDSYIDLKCGALGCNQRCVRSGEDGQYQCACRPGHRLQEDNKTCVENGRMRFYGEIRLQVEDPAVLCTNFSMILIGEVEEYIKNRFPEYSNFTFVHQRYPSTGNLDDYSDSTIWAFDGYEDGYMYVGFFFIGDKSGKNLMFSMLIGMLKRNVTVCDLLIDPRYVVYDVQPALHSMSLHNYENRPVIEGQLLTLVCKAKGSKDLSFQWLKDGYVLDMERSSRNIWETKIPSVDEETHISVLNIEKVHHLDEGTFLCNVTDWGEYQVKSVYVRVEPVPVPEVFPLISTVEAGQSVTLTCISREDELAKFMYRWVVNDDPVLRGFNNEVVEALLPTGSRLRLQSVKVSANYTCKITSRAGVASKTARIVRVDPWENFCEQEHKDGISWTRTSSGMWDLQPCPSDSFGWSRRSCTCPKGKDCHWEAPDYQNCTSYTLRSYLRRITQLSLGYQVSTVKNYTTRLLAVMENNNFKYRGDVGIVTKIIRTLLTYTRDFLSNDTLDTRMVLSMINASMFEAISMHSLYNLPHLPLNVMALVDLLSSNIKLYENETMNINTKTIDFVTASFHPGSPSYSVVYNDKLDVSLENDPFKTGNESIRTTDLSVNVTVTVFKSNSFFRDSPYTGMEEYRLDSLLLTIGFMQSLITLPDQSVHIVSYYVRFHHPSMTMEEYTMREMKCMSLDNGEWKLSSACEIHQATQRETVCKCVGPGSLALAAKKIYREDIVEEVVVPEVMILVSSIISLVSFVLVAFINICFLRKSLGKGIVMHLQYVCVLIIIDGILIGGFFKTAQPILCQSITMMLFIMYTIAMALVLADSVGLYKNIVHKTSMTACQQMTVVFGILVMMTILLAILGAKLRLSGNGYVCWISFPYWESILLCSIGGFTVLLYTIYISLVCKTLIKGAKDEDTRERILVVCRCLVNQVLLLGGIISSVLLATYPSNLVSHYCFGAFHCCLALFHLHLTLCKCLNNQQCEWSFSLDNKGFKVPDDCSGIKNKVISCIWENKKLYHTSTKDSLISANISQRSASIEEALHRRNSLKYTREKKYKLMSLLGTASCQCNKEDGLCRCTEVVPSISNKRCYPLRGRSFIVDDTTDADDPSAPLNPRDEAPVPFPELASSEAQVLSQCKSGLCRGKCICSPSSKLLPNVVDVTDPDRALVTFKRKEPSLASVAAAGRKDSASSSCASTKASESSETSANAHASPE